MKKLIIIALVIILAGFLVYGIYSMSGLYNMFLKRTPERILKTVFDISLKDFDYSVETFEDLWALNDGYTLIVYQFHKLSPNNINYLKSFCVKPLPVSIKDKRQMWLNRIPRQFLKADHGFYLYRAEKTVDLEKTNLGITRESASDFYIFIIDTVENRAVLYYQFM